MNGKEDLLCTKTLDMVSVCFRFVVFSLFCLTDVYAQSRKIRIQAMIIDFSSAMLEYLDTLRFDTTGQLVSC